MRRSAHASTWRLVILGLFEDAVRSIEDVVFPGLTWSSPEAYLEISRSIKQVSIYICWAHYSVITCEKCTRSFFPARRLRLWVYETAKYWLGYLLRRRVVIQSSKYNESTMRALLIFVF